MKIAFIVPSLANSGPVIVVQNLCKGLVAHGNHCKVFYFDDIVELDMPCAVERISFFKKFKFSDWDIIHSHMLRPDLWVVWHKPIFKKNSTALFTTLHNPISHRAHPLHNNKFISKATSFVWQFILRQFNHIVVLSSHSKSILPEFLQNKSSVVFNGKDINIVSSLSNPTDHKAIEQLRSKYKIAGVVGSLDQRKGVEQMVKALENLSEYALVVVGDGNSRKELNALAKELNVSDRCYFVGYTKQATEYFSTFDVFVMTSRSEGFPLALIEAAAYGLPCVLSNIGVFNAIVPNNRTILQYELNNIADLCHKIDFAYQNSKVLSENILRFYQHSLTVEQMSLNYISLYKNKTLQPQNT